jgi:hypothetical protein
MCGGSEGDGEMIFTYRGSRNGEVKIVSLEEVRGVEQKADAQKVYV